MIKRKKQENYPEVTNVKKRKLKKKYRILIWWLLFLLCLSGFIFSLYHTLLWNNDNKKINELEENLEKVKVKVINPSHEEDENTTLVNEPKKETDIYWKYKDVDMIDVDIKKLKNDNNDTVGWLQVPGTNINYPVVQAKNNDYYLNHDYLKRKNNGGWVFLDYRNDFDNLNQNNIIYGHERYNSSVFGSLKNLLNRSWLNNTDNHIIKVSTLKYNYLFQVFSVYTIPNETYYIQTTFNDDEVYKEFLDTIVKRSIHNFNTEVNKNTKILTLSTCYNNDRLAVHAKLIKINEKN